MEAEVISDRMLVQGLHEHPQIRRRTALLLSAVRDAGGISNLPHRLRTDRLDPVLNALQPRTEPADIEDDRAPVRQCHRYLSLRLQQMNHQSAIDQGLPIGSGDMESALSIAAACS